jgi:hypothetical protein
MRYSAGTFSFESPAGFTVQASVTLTRPGAKPQPPLGVTLTQDQVGQLQSPLAFLEGKLSQLREHLQRYALVSCEASTVGTHRAAKAQFTFVAEVELVQLVLVWFMGETLMTATVTTTAPGVADGWAALDAVATSVRPA